MTTCCNFKFNCSAAAFLASLIIGIVTAFLQIIAVITVSPVFLWVVFGIAVVYLMELVAAAALTRRDDPCVCLCTALHALLAGLLGTVLLAVVLLAVGITATSVLSAILVGLLAFFFTLSLTSSACLVKCLTGCEN